MVLDDDFFEDNSLDLKKDEKIIWRGNPRKYFSITFLEIFGPYDSLSIITGYQILTLMIIYQEAKNKLFDDNYALFIGTIIIGSLIFILPDIYKNYKKINTEYYATGDRILIKTTKLFKPKLKWIWKSDISRITYQEFKNGSGILFFIPKRKSKIKTRDYFALRRRHYPTFELIDNVLDVHHLLNDLYFN